MYIKPEHYLNSTRDITCNITRDITWNSACDMTCDSACGITCDSACGITCNSARDITCNNACDITSNNARDITWVLCLVADISAVSVSSNILDRSQVAVWDSSIVSWDRPAGVTICNVTV